MSTSAHISSALGGEGGAADQRGPKATSGAAVCRVDGCGSSLANEKRFYRRSRCCRSHALAEQVLLNGEAKRFCQQCCGFHDVAAFDGPRRSCRERLAAHKDRQRRKWQASHGRRSASGTSEDEDDAGREDAGGDDDQPTTVTRAGRPSRRPNLLRVSTGTSDSAGTSPERRVSGSGDSLKRVSPSSARAVPAPMQRAPSGSSPGGSTHGGSMHGGGSGHGGGSFLGSSMAKRSSSGSLAGATRAEHRSLLPPLPQAMVRQHSDMLDVAQRGGSQLLRGRRSASMSQMQAQAVPPAEFWLNDRGEPLAAPQHPRNVQGGGGVNPHEVSWFPDLQAWHRSPTASSPVQAADTEAALWSRRPTKRRSVPAAQGAVAPNAWPGSAGQVYATHSPPEPLTPQWHDIERYQHHQPHPAASSFRQQPPQLLPPPLQGQAQMLFEPTAAVMRHDGMGGGGGGVAQRTQFPGFDTAAEATSATGQDDWERSLAAMDVQQGLAAMGMQGGSEPTLQHDHGVLAAAAQLHQAAAASAGNTSLSSALLGLPDEAQAEAFASQAPEPLWLAQQLVGTHLRSEARPLYSYGISDVLRSLSGPEDEQVQRPLPQGRQQDRGSGASQQPVQLAGRFASSSAPTPAHFGHTEESLRGAAHAAHRAAAAAAQEQASWATQQAVLEARQAEVVVAQRELQAEYMAMAAGRSAPLFPSDRQQHGTMAEAELWCGRLSAPPAVDTPTTAHSVPWSSGFGGQAMASAWPGAGGDAGRDGGGGGQGAAAAAAVAPRPPTAPTGGGTSQGWPPSPPPSQPSHRPNSAA